MESPTSPLRMIIAPAERDPATRVILAEIRYIGKSQSCMRAAVDLSIDLYRAIGLDSMNRADN